ncbi:uncharacterized protein TM35_000041330 [Trypanosoma theileri]|uniref:Transglutaminase n=1 Tax=Trypanosoma theileri TaxID=67003 RepID=A0A1X0P5T7_9TRYP|nr:uncharacterized protein TM35_000041330 [Trypanosoma theileri]ORC91919.1 hypothetical protein TM35_000041330 [Trypanosoma theileri]
MTTMFIQLRYVVYPLVLLQCCVFVVHAVENNIPPPDPDVPKAVEYMKDFVNQTTYFLAQGSACTNTWDRHLKYCVSNSTAAEEAAKEMKTLLEAVREAKKKDGGVVSEGGKKASAEVRKVLGDVLEKMKAKKGVVAKARAEVENTRRLFEICRITYVNMGDWIGGRHDSARPYYFGLIEEENRRKPTNDLEVLYRRGKSSEESLLQLYATLDRFTLKSRAHTGEVNGHVVKAQAAMEEAYRGLAAVKELVDEGEVQFKNDVEKLRDIVKPLEQAGESGGAAGTGGPSVGDTEVPKSSMVSTGGGMIAPVRLDPSNTSGVVEELEEEKKKETKRVVQEKKEEERRLLSEAEERERQRKAEADKRIAEERSREEEKKRLAEKEELAAKERERVAEAQQRAEEERKKLEKLAEEEKARKAKEELAKNTKRRKDGTSSPALMHRSLLLLLLCVLGYTLVC